ncbi:MAG: CIA30 family protein [Phormidesmis sp.]
MQQLLGQNRTVPGMTLSAIRKKAVVIDSRSSSLFAQLSKQLSPTLDLIFYPSDADLTMGGGRAQPSDLARLVQAVDTVVVLEAPDLASLVARLATYLKESSDVCQSVFDFSSPGAAAMWGALDDVVMGGVSQGNLFLQEQSVQGQPAQTQAIFAGNVSTDNSGGFSSVRTKNFDPPFDFAGWHGVRLRVKGDGQRYKFILRNSGGWDSPAYIYGFDTVAATWIAVDIPFAEMVPTFRARSMSDAPAFDPTQVFSFQLMLSKFEYDQRLNPHFEPGPFTLAVSSISVQRPRPGVSLIVVGAPDEVAQSHQESALKSAQINWIEPGTEVEGAIIAALS